MTTELTLLYLALGIAYVVPTLIALFRHAQSVWAIAALNLLFGWTLIVWFGASVWALVDRPHQRA